MDLLENSDNDSNQSDDSEPSNNEVELDPIVAFQNAELLLGNAENEVRQKLFVLIDITRSMKKMVLLSAQYNTLT